MSNENSYKSIFKGLSAFAGVQTFQIIVNLVRGKLVAIFLGPEGMGAASIFTSVFNIGSQASTLGMNLGVVREAAESRKEPDRIPEMIGVVVGIFRLTAFIGALLCVLFCVPLSRLSFGNDTYAWQFALLGASIYLNVRGGCLLSLLQGLHRVERVAKASLVGALTGLFVGVPLYWLFGTGGIVPAMVALQLSLYVFYRFGLKREAGAWKAAGDLRAHRSLVRKLLSLGLVALSGPLIGAGCEYGVNLFLRLVGNLDIIGLYQGANSLTNQYTGIVFAAMAMDYFPRLTASIGNAREVNVIVSRQIEIVSLAITPIACAAIIFTPLIIKLLLTRSFESVAPLMRLMSMGVAFKALHFSLGYVPFASDDRKMFFWMECIGANVAYVLGITVGFLLGGLEGIGWAYIAENALTLAVYLLVNARRYHIDISRQAYSKGAVCLLLVGICFGGAFFAGSLPETAGDILMWGAGGVSFLYGALRLKKLLRAN